MVRSEPLYDDIDGMQPPPTMNNHCYTALNVMRLLFTLSSLNPKVLQSAAKFKIYASTPENFLTEHFFLFVFW